MFNPIRIRTLASLALITGAMLSAGAQTPPAVAPTTSPAAQPPASRPAQAQPAIPATDVPNPRIVQWWVDRHNRRLQDKLAGPIDLIFIGDSITQGWENAGAEVWAQRYAPRHPLNLGFSGDGTEHVLWRLQYNEVEGIAPKLAVVMIGTNNSNGNDHTAEEIAAGIHAVVASLREKLPQTKVLLLGIFPRGEKPNPQREKNAAASKLASTAADGKMVHYLDIGAKLMNADGVIAKDIMPDFLHLSPRGYEIWADAIDEQLKALMGEVNSGKPKPTEP